MNLSRFIKYGVFFASFCLILLAALLLIVPLFISSQTMRHGVAVHLSSLTGQSITVAGDSRFTPLPSPTIRLSKVQIGGGDGLAPIMESGVVEAHLSVMALVMGRIEIMGLTLDAPRILLNVAPDGLSNWRNGGSILSLLSPQQAQDTGQPRTRLGRLTLRNGVISYQDHQAERRSEISQVNMVIAWPDLGAPLTANGSFFMRDEKVVIDGQISRPSALFRRQISPFNLSFATKVLKWAVSGDAFSVQDIQLEGKLDFSSASLQQLSAWLVPELRAGPQTGPITGSAKLKMADRTLTLGEMKLAVDQSRGEGYLAFTFDKTRTGVQGTLDFDTADLSPYLGVSKAGGAIKTAQSALSPLPFQDIEPLRADRLGPVDVDLRLSAAQLTAGTLQIKEAALSVLARDGRLEMSLADGAIYGGRIAARLATTALAQDGVMINALLMLTDVKLDDALRELFGIVRLTGTGSLALDVNGEGEAMTDIGQTLKGDARLTVKSGVLTGVDIATLIKRAERNPVEAFLEARGGRTTIDAARASFAIMDGKASTQDMSIEGTGYRVQVKGNTDIATRNLSFNGVLSSPSALPEKAGFELPFVVRGPWSDPIIVPNPEALIRRTAP